MEAISLSRIIAYWADRQSDAVAIFHEGETITWRDLESSTNRLARAYEQLGVKPDDFVTIALANGIEFFQATIATWKLGATPQPISAKLPEFERVQIVELGAPSLVVGVNSGAHDQVATIPSGYQPDVTLSDTPLPEKNCHVPSKP